ncbi:MAG TPA: hypothetical protein VNM72_07535 [Blastocatellia bacterium]|nr:hypothetical protein [Blastocatellia bacterium]
MPPISAKIHSRCRVCGETGKPVKRRTIEHLLKESSLPRLTDHPYFFCATPTCSVVYFSNEADSYFHKADVKVRVGLKETEDPVPVCYCFNITEKMIHDEIEATGRTTIPDYIRAQVKAGRCACEIKNPSGRCCLGVVTEVVRRGLKLRGIAHEPNDPPRAMKLLCSQEVNCEDAMLHN